MAKKKTAAKSKPRGTRKSTLQKKRAAQKTEAFNYKKPLALLVIVLLVSWCGFWFVASDYDEKLANHAQSESLKLTEKAGFRVENILVEGREYTSSDVLLAIINVKEGDPIFSFDPKEAKTQIEKISWVKSAHVERHLPDTIYVHLEERQPLALWLNNKQLSLIDANGAVLTQEDLEQFKNLLMVKGKVAPAHTPPLVNMIENKPDIKQYIDHVELIDQRRWDIILKDGKRIKLPEHNIGAALNTLMEKHLEHQILTQETIRDIDARYNGRLIVRTHLGGVQDYKAGLRETSL